MEKLPPSQEILSLGKQLVNEFSQGDRCKMTVRWLCHYLSECIVKAEREKRVKAKKLLEKECVELILRLWKERNYFPEDARPLANLSEALTVLAALHERERDAESWSMFITDRNQSGWGKFMKETYRKLSEILALSLCATLSADALKKEKKWLKNKALLSEEERTIIEKLDYLLTKSDSYIRIVFTNEMTERKKGKEKPETRVTRVFEKIQGHLDDLDHILETLKKEKQVKPVKKRK